MPVRVFESFDAVSQLALVQQFNTSAGSYVSQSFESSSGINAPVRASSDVAYDVSSIQYVRQALDAVSAMPVNAEVEFHTGFLKKVSRSLSTLYDIKDTEQVREGYDLGSPTLVSAQSSLEYGVNGTVRQQFMHKLSLHGLPVRESLDTEYDVLDTTLRQKFSAVWHVNSTELSKQFDTSYEITDQYLRNSWDADYTIKDTQPVRQSLDVQSSASVSRAVETGYPITFPASNQFSSLYDLIDTQPVRESFDVDPQISVSASFSVDSTINSTVRNSVESDYSIIAVDRVKAALDVGYGVLVSSTLEIDSTVNMPVSSHYSVEYELYGLERVNANFDVALAAGVQQHLSVHYDLNVPVSQQFQTEYEIRDVVRVSASMDASSPVPVSAPIDVGSEVNQPVRQTFDTEYEIRSVVDVRQALVLSSTMRVNSGFDLAYPITTPVRASGDTTYHITNLDLVRGSFDAAVSIQVANAVEAGYHLNHKLASGLDVLTDIRDVERVTAFFDAGSSIPVSAPIGVTHHINGRVTAGLQSISDISDTQRITKPFDAQARIPVSKQMDTGYPINTPVSMAFSVNYQMTLRVTREWAPAYLISLLDAVRAKGEISYPLIGPSGKTTNSQSMVEVYVDPAARLAPGHDSNPDGTTNPYWRGLGYEQADIRMDEGSPYWDLNLTLADNRDRKLMSPKTQMRVSVGGDTFYFLVDSVNVTRPESDPGINISVVGKTPTIEYEKPRHEGFTKLWDENTNASTIVTELLGTVDWQIVDWNIPAFRVAIERGSPIDLAAQIVKAAGGVLEPKDGGGFVARYKYPVSPVVYGTVASDAAVGTITDVFSLGEVYALSDYDDRLRIMDTGIDVADRVVFEEDEEDNEKGVLHVYPSPWDDAAYVTHTGSGTVQLNRLGVRSRLIEDEVIEIFEGAGSTREPIYSIESIQWLSKNLLGVVFEPGGNEVQSTHTEEKFSLLKISYYTKSIDYEVYSPDDEAVQFLVNRET